MNEKSADSSQSNESNFQFDRSFNGSLNQMDHLATIFAPEEGIPFLGDEHWDCEIISPY